MRAISMLVAAVLTSTTAVGTTFVPARAAGDGAGVRGSGDMVVVRGTDGWSGPGSDGRTGAGCGADCPTVVLTPVCLSFGYDVQPVPPRLCVEQPTDCPPGTVGRWVWVPTTAGLWVIVDQTCAQEGAGVPLATIHAGVVERVRHRLPALDPARQPARRALIGLPVLFDSGQLAGSRSWTDEVAGFTVTTTVSPSWVWDFGDGHTLSTTTPGSRYPDLAVSHEYDSLGNRSVEVTTTWDGEFTIAGAGSFPISGEVVQQAELAVTVVEARAVLVPSQRSHG